jgi:TonB-dependent receptor
LNQPDKVQFGSMWWAPSYNQNATPPISPAVYLPFKPAANFTIGNVQEIWKDISEDSGQYFVNLKYPFEQWSGDKGYFKVGVFNDVVKRTYNQESFSNFNDNSASYQASWDQSWSQVWDREDHPMTPADIDDNYRGRQKISAWYYMADVPTCHYLDIIGGVRYETTDLSIVNQPEPGVTWFPKGSGIATQLNPGDADVAFNQKDALPSIGLAIKPVKQVKVQAVYSETVARQTFKELTPIEQEEFLGGPVFIGNPDLQMSAIKNYDIRADYTPTVGQLFSIGWFRKNVTNPIEYVQRVATFTYTTPVNYPKGMLQGIELEARQQMGQLSKPLKGLTLGGNVTFISSQVTLPEDEAAGFLDPNIQHPMRTRDMTGAPNHLYNIYATYDIERYLTQVGLFYTVKGDALVAGAGQANGHFVPNVYEKEYGTLNFTATKKLSKNFTLRFQAKNLLNPAIDTVYRTDGEDFTRTSVHRGMEFWVGLSVEF